MQGALMHGLPNQGSPLYYDSQDGLDLRCQPGMHQSASKTLRMLSNQLQR